MTMVFDSEMIVQVVLIMPPWLAGGAEAETVTVTVTTENVSLTDAINIHMLPFILDDQKNLNQKVKEEVKEMADGFLELIGEE